jgi:hypothetical protein
MMLVLWGLGAKPPESKQNLFLRQLRALSTWKEFAWDHDHSMRGHVLTVVAAFTAGCTSTTEVMVTPAQLQQLAGIEPTEKRNVASELTPPRARLMWQAQPKEGEPLVVTGDDVVRLQIRPDATVHVRDEALGKLYTLRWGAALVSVSPTTIAGEPEFGPVRVPIGDVTGASLELTRPDPVATASLIVLCVIGAGVAATAAAVIVGNQKKPVVFTDAAFPNQ